MHDLVCSNIICLHEEAEVDVRKWFETFCVLPTVFIAFRVKVLINYHLKFSK